MTGSRTHDSYSHTNLCMDTLKNCLEELKIENQNLLKELHNVKMDNDILKQTVQTQQEKLTSYESRIDHLNREIVTYKNIHCSTIHTLITRIQDND